LFERHPVPQYPREKALFTLNVVNTVQHYYTMLWRINQGQGENLFEKLGKILIVGEMIAM